MIAIVEHRQRPNMRLLVAVVTLWASSALHPRNNDPRRGGEAEAQATQLCPAPGCGKDLHPAGGEYVCENRHAYRWDYDTKSLVQADD